MRAGPLRRSIGAGSKIGCVLDIDFRKVDVAADQYFMECSVYGHRCQAKSGAHWHADGWDFEGVDDYVTVPSHFGFGNTNASIRVQVNLDSVAEHGGFVLIGGESEGFGLGVGDGTFVIGGNDCVGLYSGVRWMHNRLIGLGRHNAEMVIHPNGVPELFLDGLSFGTLPGANANAPTTDCTLIGSHALMANRWVDAIISRVHIYNFAEYAARILQRAIDSRRN